MDDEFLAMTLVVSMSSVRGRISRVALEVPLRLMVVTPRLQVEVIGCRGRGLLLG